MGGSGGGGGGMGGGGSPPPPPPSSIFRNTGFCNDSIFWTTPEFFFIYTRMLGVDVRNWLSLSIFGISLPIFFKLGMS